MSRLVTGRLVQGEDGLWREEPPEPFQASRTPGTVGRSASLEALVVERFAAVHEGQYWFLTDNGYANGVAFSEELQERLFPHLKVATVWRKVNEVLHRNGHRLHDRTSRRIAGRDPDGVAVLGQARFCAELPS